MFLLVTFSVKLENVQNQLSQIQQDWGSSNHVLNLRYHTP